MAITKLNTRLMQKYDTEENWGKASGFIPLKGEKIIYAPDDTHPYVREKTGDGVTAVTALPFDENYRGDIISSNQTGASLYVKLCTVQSLAAHSDIFIEFDMAGRSFERFQKVKFIPRRNAATTTPTCAVFVSGGKGNPYQVRAYQYQFKNIENDYIELWCVLPGYDVLNILKRSFASNWKSAEQNFIWNYEVANAWPTESESVIKVNAIMEEWTGNSATATKLKTARKIGKASFDGTTDITLDAIAGRAITKSSGSAYINQYIKFARIDVSSGAYTDCSGTLEFCPTEACTMFGELAYQIRTTSTIETTGVRLWWKTLTDVEYANRVSAVKVSNGIYDLYYRPMYTYETMSITNVDCHNPNKITLYSDQNYVKTITAAAAISSLHSASDSATQDGNGNVISTTYATKDEVSDTYLTKTNAIQTYATKTSVSSTYLTKTDAGNTYAVKDEEFITVEDIDEICGTTIQVATLSEVTF